MTTHRNVFACLVHESQECVVDLVRNLRFIDPSSAILLYNGGRDPALLTHGFPFERYGALVYPFPRPLAWGRLHDFAIDCMRYALEHLPFDTLTIVDSDQLATRSGYSACLQQFLAHRRNVGMLGSCPQVLDANAKEGPVVAAFQEIDGWRPFLQRFPDGESKFGHWSFWPSTVFTAAAARDLVQLFDHDAALTNMLGRTQIWATEEVILPLVTALLGYEIAKNPCSNDFVKYRVSYSESQVEQALSRPDVFWMHPVNRRYDDAVRKQIRGRLNHYTEHRLAPLTNSAATGVLLTAPILRRMSQIEGWLDDQEADALIAVTSRALTSVPAGVVVEVGSFHGRSTVVLGSVVRATGASASVFAIDPHDGQLGSLDQQVEQHGPTLAAFQRNIAANGLSNIVVPLLQRSTDVVWDQPIGLLFIDGLHDYVNVARDFHHFEKHVLPGAYVAFHDYADYYPGVKTFVDELLQSGDYEMAAAAGSLVAVRRRLVSDFAEAPAVITRYATSDAPLVSCLMPTANRRDLAPRAIQHFLRQDYPERELVIIDDGSAPIADLIPNDPRIRYIRLHQRLTIGAKHNLACEQAWGEVMVHWDDDDWMADWRISYQVAELLSRPPDTLCGLSRMYFYEPNSHRAWEYVYPLQDKPWVGGGTFCYAKDFWRRRPFPDMNEGGDTLYVWNLEHAKVAALDDNRFYVATVHSRNTSPKKTDGPGWHPRSKTDVCAMIDNNDWLFFESLAK
jgi:Methyltransferase domain/Glycosyl transferase family 2